MKWTNKNILCFLSIVSVLLIVNTFLNQLAESKISDYRNNLTFIQNNLNSELSRVLYYTLNSNQNEMMALLLLNNQNLDLDSSLIPRINPVKNEKIKNIEKIKSELRSKMKKNEISFSEYYKEKLNISAKLFEEHFNNFNKLNADYQNELNNPTNWIELNRILNFFQMILILLTIIGQSFLIVNKFKKTDLKIK